MEFQDFITRFTDCKIKFNEKLSGHNSYKVGGKAKYFVLPKSYKSLLDLIWYLESYKIPYFVIGKGTNLLVSDSGYDGAVISLELIKGIKLSGNIITVKSSESLIKLTNFAYLNSLTGIEELSGIAGSVGGAVYMNAGAFGKSIGDCVLSVTTLCDGKIKVYRKDECKFSYRKSRFYKSNEIILSISICLDKGNKAEIKKKILEYREKRLLSQPKGLSCGSVFKNPKGGYSAKLIESLGLKGKSIGGATVSSKHANFIINQGNATATDIFNLIKYVKEKVKDAYGLELKEEVVFVGEFK